MLNTVRRVNGFSPGISLRTHWPKSDHPQCEPFHPRTSVSRLDGWSTNRPRLWQGKRMKILKQKGVKPQFLSPNHFTVLIQSEYRWCIPWLNQTWPSERHFRRYISRDHISASEVAFSNKHIWDSQYIKIVKARCWSVWEQDTELMNEAASLFGWNVTKDSWAVISKQALSCSTQFCIWIWNTWRVLL